MSVRWRVQIAEYAPPPRRFVEVRAESADQAALLAVRETGGYVVGAPRPVAQESEADYAKRDLDGAASEGREDG